MSYKCQVCGRAQPPGTSLRKHTVYRNKVTTRLVGNRRENVTNRQIDREVPVCEECESALNSGVPLYSLAARYQKACPYTRAYNRPVGGGRVTVTRPRPPAN